MITPSDRPDDQLGERITGIVAHIVRTQTMKSGTLQITVEVERPSHWDSLILTDHHDELLYFDVHEYSLGADDVDWDALLDQEF